MNDEVMIVIFLACACSLVMVKYSDGCVKACSNQSIWRLTVLGQTCRWLSMNLISLLIRIVTGPNPCP
jgi:hypothetical protein